MKKKFTGIFVCTLLLIATVIPAAGNIKKESTEPLLAINTSVDAITPYNQPFSPLKITATGPNDLDDVTLYYKWSKDNISWSGVQHFSIVEGFESGTQNTSLWNTYQTGGDARIQWNYNRAQGGAFSCGMDDFDTNQGDFALNVIYTNHDFTGARNINLEFWQREWDDESHEAPNSWTGWGYYDVVAFTNDGNTWYEIVSESNLNIETWTDYEVNISADEDFSSPATGNFAIAFQQYDNYRLTDDGRAWDEIYIDYTTGGPSYNWSDWKDSSNPDTSYPWGWNFNFPNGTGYYEFYSIGTKTGEDDEVPPTNADARCRFNRKPEIFDEVPRNGSTGVNIIPQLNISVSDADYDIMTIKWYTNRSGTWKRFARNINVTDGTYSQINNKFNKFGTTYWWNVSVTDGIYTNTSPIFHFTTENNLPPYTPNTPNPPDGATDVSIEKILLWLGGDPNAGDTVTYDVYFGTNSPPPFVDTVTQAAYDPGTMPLDTTYYWQVVAEDGEGLTATGPIWSFTTEREANEPPSAPDIYGPPSGQPEVELFWAFDADDPDGNKVKYNIEWGDGTTSETDYSHIAMEASHIYDELGEYRINATAEDEKGLVGKVSSFQLKIEKTKSASHLLLLRIFHRFPLLERLWQKVIKIIKQ
jgi:hypothetical protein